MMRLFACKSTRKPGLLRSRQAKLPLLHRRSVRRALSGIHCGPSPATSQYGELCTQRSADPFATQWSTAMIALVMGSSAASHL